MVRPNRPLQTLLRPAGARWAFAIGAVIVCLVLPRSRFIRAIVVWIQERSWRAASLFALALWGLGWAEEWSLLLAVLLGIYGLFGDIAARYRARTVLLSR